MNMVFLNFERNSIFDKPIQLVFLFNVIFVWMITSLFYSDVSCKQPKSEWIYKLSDFYKI